MPPGQVSRGQGSAGLRFLTRFLSPWRRHDKDKNTEDVYDLEDHNSHFGSGNSSTVLNSQPAFPPPCVARCVPDNDPGIDYSASWSLSPNGLYRSSHQTGVVGSSLSFNFEGTGITVYGSVPASNATFQPPTAAYSIDAAAPVVTTEPLAAHLVINQPLFFASGLVNGKHSLAIEVLNVSSATPFALEYFIVNANTGSTSTHVPSPSAPSGTHRGQDHQHSDKSKELVGILAGVLVAVGFILICLALFVIVLKRRRQRRAQRTKDIQSSLFTSPESIAMYSRQSYSHQTAGSWFGHGFAPPRSTIAKSWISNLDVKSTSQGSESSQTSHGNAIAFKSLAPSQAAVANSWISIFSDAKSTSQESQSSESSLGDVAFRSYERQNSNLHASVPFRHN